VFRPAVEPTAVTTPVRLSPPRPETRPLAATLLRPFLQAYWLRPENAYWMALRSAALAELDGPPIDADISCGDGIFSFIHAGGRFDESFDVFAAAGNLDRITHAHADMFDCPAADYAPPVCQPPLRRMHVGTDLKPALLDKARALDFYDTLHLHDANEPQPFEDESFSTVYCNSAYWVPRIDVLLSELRRITREGGRVVLHVKLASMRDYTLERFRGRLGADVLRILGRGRLECWPALATRSEWERRFAAAGLHVERCTPFITRTHARLWDVGIRPIAPLLVRMTRELAPATRAAIKRDWTALFETLLLPLCDPAFELVDDRAEPAEVQYVLRR